MTTLATFGLTTAQKASARNAPAIVAEQDRVHQNAVTVQPGVNAPVDQVAPAAVPPSDSQRAMDKFYSMTGMDDNGQPIYDASYVGADGTGDPGTLAKGPAATNPNALAVKNVYNTPPPLATATDGKGVIQTDREKRQAAEGATPEQIATNKKNLQGILNAPPEHIASLQDQLTQLQKPIVQEPGESAADFAARKAATAHERLSISQELQLHQNAAAPTPAATTTTPAPADTTATATPDAPFTNPDTTTDTTTNPMLGAVNQSITALGGVVASIAASAPPELQPLYQAAFTMLQARAQDLSSQLTDTENVTDEVTGQYQTIIQGMLDSRKSMLTTGQALLESSKNEQLDLINQQKAADLAQNSAAQALFNAQVNNESRRREQELGVDTQHSMNAVAIEGGFGDLNKYSEIDRVHNVGEQQITNYIGEMALQGQQYVAKALEIDAAYTSKTVQAHQDFNDKSLALMSSYNDKVEEAEKLLLGNSEKKMQAYADARKEFRTGWTSIQSETIATIKDATKEAVATKRQFDLETYRDRRNAWSEVNSYLVRFGNTMDPAAKAYLSSQETRLGLPAGTLTNQKTLAQIKKTSSTGGSGNPLTSKTTDTYVTTQRAMLVKAHPELKNNPSAIDALLLSATKSNYPGAKNQAFLRDVSDFVNTNNIGAKPYFVNYDAANTDKFTAPKVDLDPESQSLLDGLYGSPTTP